MATSKVEYLGELRTKCTHLKSNTEIITDAPLDNHGKGEAFSPTDLLATSYASCMITIIGIYCNNHNIDFNACEATVEKKMLSHPRRVGGIDIILRFPDCTWDKDLKAKIIKAAENCPVAHSIHPDIEVNISYHFD